MAKLSSLILPAILALGLSLPAGAAPAEPEGDPAEPAPLADPATVRPTATVGFSPAMKDTIRAYYKGKGCARGMAEPVAGCIPRRDPSTAPRYSVGKPLPSGMEAAPLPKPLASAMAAPEGYGFGLVDGDVLLLADDNRRVADTYPAIDPAAP
ncbi:hypothetical protein [Emcibacter sp. SYSU 3D8]|uniref:hypothetical protein n=1 Tax=Emcibacter sp. SYSU 3D8 TaxID=3133969 RepID=UPI0031FF2F73